MSQSLPPAVVRGPDLEYSREPAAGDESEEVAAAANESGDEEVDSAAEAAIEIMSLRSLGYLLTRRFYPRKIYRVQAESSLGIVSQAASVSAAGRPGRSLHTLVSLRSHQISDRKFLPSKSQIENFFLNRAHVSDMESERSRRW